MVYFISGHRNITMEEFNKFYVNKIITALEDPNTEFVVGDYDGVDTIAQQYLVGKTDKVTVYHMGDEPMNNVGNYKRVPGYTGDIERDSAMTLESDKDIAWVREIGANTGTEQNIIRRKDFWKGW